MGKGRETFSGLCARLEFGKELFEKSVMFLISNIRLGPIRAMMVLLNDVPRPYTVCTEKKMSSLVTISKVYNSKGNKYCPSKAL